MNHIYISCQDWFIFMKLLSLGDIAPQYLLNILSNFDFDQQFDFRQLLMTTTIQGAAHFIIV